MDPPLRRAADALRPGGVLAVVRTRHVDGGARAFSEAAQDPPLFTAVEGHHFPAEVTCASGEHLGLLQGCSANALLPPAAREGLLGCLARLLDHGFAGRVTMRCVVELVLATRSDDAQPRCGRSPAQLPWEQ